MGFPREQTQVCRGAMTGVVNTQILLCLEESVFYTTGGEMLRKKKQACIIQETWVELPLQIHTSKYESDGHTEVRRMKESHG